jgi:putative addiction module CopG family antidote
MNINVPLTPHQEQFLREQLASGNFQTEGDVLRAALRLLEEQSQNSVLAGGKPQLEQGLSSRASGDDTAAIPSPRRSPRGILADIRSYISPDDIKEARIEMWSGFPHGEA